MPKSAASIARELSDLAKDDDDYVDDDEIITGGIVEPSPVQPEAPKARTGTPFDLVSGRPNVDYWGPFESYTFVQTPHGEYAIPDGKILRFQMVKEWDRKEGVEVVRAHPRYEDAPAELLAYVTG